MRVRVCRIDEVAEGEPRAFTVKGTRVVVTVSDGDLYACEGTCPHQAAPLTEGLVSDNLIVCGVHFYGFDLRSGRCTHDANLVLRRYAVTRVGNDVWIDLD